MKRKEYSPQAQQPFTGVQRPMRFKPPNFKRLQGAADAWRGARRRPIDLQVPDNKADAVPCERLPGAESISVKGEQQ